MSALYKRITCLLCAIIICFSLFCLIGNFEQAEAYSDQVNEIIELINDIRRQNGLPEYEIDSTLCEAAQIRAEELAVSFSHKRPDGTECSTVLEQFGIKCSVVGENISMNYDTPKKAVSGWMSSEGHRKNILSGDYKKLGVGYNSKNNMYVQLFIKLPDESIVKETPSDTEEPPENTFEYADAGDVDRSGKLDILDVVLARSYIVGNTVFSKDQIKIGDVDKNGKLDILDIVLMRANIVNGK